MMSDGFGKVESTLGAGTAFWFTLPLGGHLRRPIPSVAVVETDFVVLPVRVIS